MAHHCISNPCWICYPKFAPEHLRKFCIEDCVEDSKEKEDSKKVSEENSKVTNIVTK